MVKEEYKYHHIGLPTIISQKNEEYNEEWKFYGSGYFESKFGIEWLRIEKNSPLPPLIKTVPHIAFVVKDIDKSILGQKVIYGPNNPAEGVTVCFIEVDGAPIEFLQFDRPENKIWPNDNKLINPVNRIKNKKESVNFKYHHFGICTTSRNRDTVYLKDNKLCCSEHQVNPYGIQWIKYYADCKLPTIVQKISHIAFQVDNLKEAIKCRNVIVEPYSPSKSVWVAFIEENGAPIEFLQIS
ncbi:hypothetical protein GCM10007962_27560 [Yeosuana aromativorans]|uniref:Uncharacterized protein n=2 Tax=Yeosuana aromativorans TaxID=288019 RepID=A0A8J3BRK3_9FLAO|nr:hypothetical protein GCM10007962_27560 [Yeosuana aromativorans]